jgi:predicted RNA-binding protein YlxR (DUF448 family)
MPMKKIPMRQCLALNESFPKNELFRVVRTPEGEVYVDLKGKMNGRGAYISKNKKAIEIAKKKKILDIKLEVKVPDEIYEQLLSLIGE